MPKPARAVQDPYATAPAGISFVAPPPGAPTDGSATHMRIYVPAENTSIDLGAGTPPGINMFTAHHIDMWAGAPQTTVFLGTNPGVSGIDIYTAAQKREVIALPTEETYLNTKTETVGLALVENYNNTKAENVAGTLTENYHGTKNETVDHPLVEKYLGTKAETVTGAATNHYQSTLTEDVGGSWTVDPVKGNFTVHATGNIHIHGDDDHLWQQVGVAEWLFVSTFKKTTIGSDSSIIVGMKQDMRLAVHNDLRVGAHMDTKLAIRMVTEAAPVSEKFLLKNIAAALRMSASALDKKEGGVIRTTAVSVLHSASAHLLK